MRKIPQQIIPLIIIVGGAMAALIISRQLLIPESFGEWGFYRADAVAEIASQEVQYAGAAVCAECHDDTYATKQAAKHHGLSCEICHGPAANHAEEPDEYLPVLPDARDQCIQCHGYNPSRPTGFPQILGLLHNPGKACRECHDPHVPTLPKAPEDCSACHREIVSKKMVSRHTTLVCTVCHEVPPDHWANPTQVKAKKPTEKALCGQCHSESANAARNIPRIDIQTHGDPYLCWDCHYPHFPEAKS